MKKIHKLLLIAIILIVSNNSFAQLAENSWAVGFGATYPRFMSIWSNSYSGTENYGAYLSLQRNFSEKVALRFLGNYNYMESFYKTNSGYLKESVSLSSVPLLSIYFIISFPAIQFLLTLEPGLLEFISNQKMLLNPNSMITF